MGGKSSGGSSTTVQKADPWSEAQPDILAGLEAARGLYQSDPSGAGLFAPRDPLQVGAEDQMIQRINSGQANSGAMAGQSALGDILGRGAYGGADILMDRIQTQVQPRVDAMFSRAGRTGSNAYADTVTRAMTEAMAPALGQLYQSETENQIRAASLAPTMDQSAMAGLGVMAGIGADRRAEAQREIDAPYDALDRYFGYSTAAGGLGGTTSKTAAQPSSGGGVGSAIGGGLSGFALGNAVLPGIGGPIGAGVGILGGLF